MFWFVFFGARDYRRMIFLKSSPVHIGCSRTRTGLSRYNSPDFNSFKWGKSKWSGALFGYISIAINLAYDKNKLYKTLDYWSRDMLNFSFLGKGLGKVSTPHFVYDFSTKMFLILYSVNWPNFIVWLPLLLEILGNMCIAIVC